MCCFQKENGELVPLLIAAGGGGNAYMESSLDQISLEQYENSTTAPGTNGHTGKAGSVTLLIQIHLVYFRKCQITTITTIV